MRRKADLLIDPHTTPAEAAKAIETHLHSLTNHAVPKIRPIRRQVSAAIRTWPAKAVIQLAERLLTRREIVPRWFTYELLNSHPGALSGISASALRRLGQGLGSWGDVDAFACFVAGPAWRMGQVSDESIHQWARSKDRWWRRAAVVSTVALNCTARGGTGDARRTLAVCDLVMEDRDDMVVKAVSWALRELSVKSPAAVREYVRQNAANLHPRVVREVTNKLSTGLKNPKRSKTSRV